MLVCIENGQNLLLLVPSAPVTEGLRARGEASRTALELHLAGEARRPVGPLDAFRAARRCFLRGERLDMGRLAAGLGIGRATLYRWVGSRERLLGEILWSLAEAGLREAEAAAAGRGPERMVRFYERFLRLTAEHRPIREFIEREPEAALRVLTSREGVQQRRLIDALRRRLERAAREGDVRLPLAAGDLAYAMVRIGESFIWREFVTGEEPDVSAAVDVVRVLLGAPATGEHASR
jgi:AcrR family transcriptional regulator